MTNGPDDQDGQDLPPPPPPPPPPSRGRGLFARNDPDQPGEAPPSAPPPPPPPPRREEPRREEPPRRREPVPAAAAAAAGAPPTDDNPFLLPNERDRTPVYGAPPLPAIPLALMVLAIVVGGALFYMSRSDSGSSGGISQQQAANSLILHLDGVDMTEDAFRREIAKGIEKGRIPCNLLQPQPADNIAAGFRLGALRMEVPNASGVAQKRDQKADDASLLIAANIVKESCPRTAPAPGGTNPNPAPAPGGTNPNPAPAPAGSPAAPAPGGTNPAPAPAPGGTNPAPAPAGTPRPGTSPAAGAGGLGGAGGTGR